MSRELARWYPFKFPAGVSTRRPPSVPWLRAVPLPTKVNQYFWWTEWDALVRVSRRGPDLYVTPPCTGGLPVKISPYIAGDFLAPTKKQLGGR